MVLRFNTSLIVIVRNLNTIIYNSLLVLPVTELTGMSC